MAVAEGSATAVELPDGRVDVVVLLGVAAREPQAAKLLQLAGSRLQAKGAKASEHRAGPTALYLYERGQGKTASQAVYFIKDGVLGMTTDLGLATELVTRWGASPEKSLAALPAYREAMKQCEAGGPAPVRWFLDPVALTGAGNSAGDDEEADADRREFAARHGFDAVGGIGGTVSFAARGCDVLHRTYVHAPPPHREAMQLLRFAPVGDTPPLNRAPVGVNSYSVASLDLPNALDHVGGLFDDLLADGETGTFDRIVADLKSERGPQVDLRADLFQYLGPRVTLIGQHVLPVSATSEGLIVAVGAKLRELGGEKAVFRGFSLLDRDLLTTYELFRQGKAADSDSLYVTALNRLLGGLAEEDDAPTAPDYAKLPPFTAIQGRLGATGMFARNEPEGWLVVGFILPRAAPPRPPVVHP